MPFPIVKHLCACRSLAQAHRCKGQVVATALDAWLVQSALEQRAEVRLSRGVMQHVHIRVAGAMRVHAVEQRPRQAAVRALVHGVVRARHVGRPRVSPVQRARPRVRGEGVFAVVDDDLGLPLLQVPHLAPRGASVIASREPALEAIGLVACAVKSAKTIQA